MSDAQQEYTVRYETPLTWDLKIPAEDEYGALDLAADAGRITFPMVEVSLSVHQPDGSFRYQRVILDAPSIGDAEAYSVANANGDEVWRDPTAQERLNVANARLAKIREACRRYLRDDEHTPAGHAPAYILEILNGEH